MEIPNEDNYSYNKTEKEDEIMKTENLKKNKYIKTHTSFDENTVNEEDYDISNFNYNYDIKKKINMNNEEEGEEFDENDLSSDDEYENKYKNIKIGILKLKLNIFNKIIISKIQKYYFYFISKINLKIKSTQIFLQGDNFLYSKLKLKTSDENKFYALKKIIFVIRKNAFEKLIKQNYLYHWKIVQENKHLFNNNEASIKIKIVQFCSIIVKIFNKKYEQNYNLNYFVKKWKILLEEKEIYKNKIKKGMLILSNLFNRKIRKIFKKFPRNYLNLKQKTNIFKAINNNKQITYIIEDKEKFYQRGIQDFYNYKKKYINLLRQNKLIKLIEKFDAKNKINRNAFIFFHLLKNSSQINNYKKQIKNINNSLNDLKYDLMLNAAIIIKIILNEYIYEKLFIYKKNFLEKLYIRYKYTIIKTNYNCNEHINNDAQKEEINNLRIKYQRIFALQKILIINNRNKFFYGDLNIQLKFSLLKKYFKIWKHYTFFFSINEQIKKIATQKMFLLLNNIYINHSKKNIFNIIRKKSLQKEFKAKKYYYFSLFIYILLKQHLLLHISKKAFYFIKNIWINQQNSKLNNKNKNLQCIKLYLNYKKFSNIKKYKCLTKWNFICSCIRMNKNLFQERIKSILINIDKYNNNYILSKLFNKWNEKTQENEIENQKKEIKIYFYLNKLITMKHLTTLWLYFKKWSAISININNEYNYENLLIELEQIRKENDDLVAIYYKKRQEYAKTLYDYNYMKKYYCDSCINEKEDEIDYMSLKSNDIKEAGKPCESLKLSTNKVDINKENSKYLKKTFGETSSKQKSGLPISFDENNFAVNEENKIQTDSNMSLDEEDELSNYVGKKISQMTQETINGKYVPEDENNNIIIHDIKHENNYDQDSTINKNENINDYKNEYEEQKKYYENYINLLLEKKKELLEMKNMLMNQKDNISNIEEENK